MPAAIVIVLLFGGVLNGLTPSLGQIKKQNQVYLEVSPNAYYYYFYELLMSSGYIKQEWGSVTFC